jgi:pyridoxal phosphate enzyme (YggS family)
MLTGTQFSAENTSDSLRSRWIETRTRIASAATRAGRDPGSVGLVAISKLHPEGAIRALAEAGQRDFGENYLQEALAKVAALADLDLVWHFVGQIQSNKTRPIAENFQWVHTLDRDKVATRLNEQRSAHGPRLNVCIQVSLEAEAGKGGCEPAEVEKLARHVLNLPRLHLRGLMCIPPPQKGYSDQLELFQRLAQLQQALIAGGIPLDTLSMGMTEDLEAAVAAGATFVRIGTAIFGQRIPT